MLIKYGYTTFSAQLNQVVYIPFTECQSLCSKKGEKVSAPLDKDGRDPCGLITHMRQLSPTSGQPYFLQDAIAAKEEVAPHDMYRLWLHNKLCINW